MIAALTFAGLQETCLGYATLRSLSFGAKLGGKSKGVRGRGLKAL